METIEDDAPVSYTFASQKKERLLGAKDKNNFVAKVLGDNVEAEFELSTKFRVIEHANQFIDPDVVNNLSNQVDFHTVKVPTPRDDSDEGYNGSDEHDRRKYDDSRLHHVTVQSVLDDSYKISEPKSIDLVPSCKRSGRKFRKTGRKGAYKILLIEEQRTNSAARAEVQKFVQEKLFTTKKNRRKDTCDVQRISSNMLVKLDRKLRARRTI